MYIRLNIVETNCINPIPYEVYVFIKTKKNFASSDELCDALQDAYNEYYETLGYESEDEASNDGICFGSCFTLIPKAIQKKYVFKIIKFKEYCADYDFGFNAS